jgi:hypothetical protein
MGVFKNLEFRLPMVPVTSETDAKLDQVLREANLI